MDDIHGWNFIGGPNGEQVAQDTYELTREFAKLSKKFEGVEKSAIRGKKDKAAYAYFEQLEIAYENALAEAENTYINFSTFLENYRRASTLMKAYLYTDTIAIDLLQYMSSPDQKISEAIQTLLYIDQLMITEGILEKMVAHYKAQVEYGYNIDFDPRAKVGDNYADPLESIMAITKWKA